MLRFLRSLLSQNYYAIISIVVSLVCIIIFSHYQYAGKSFTISKSYAGNTQSCNNADIILIIDESDSMKQYVYINGNSGPVVTKIQAAQIAAKQFVSDIQNDNDNNTRIGVTTFAGKGVLQQPLTTDFNAVDTALSNLTTVDDHTNFQAGVDTAEKEILNDGNPNNQPIAIFLTDGITRYITGPDGNPKNVGETEAQNVAQSDAFHGWNALGLVFFTIGFGQAGQINQQFLQQIDYGGTYNYAPDQSTLQSIYDSLSTSCPTPTPTPPPATNYVIQGQVFVDTTGTGYNISPDQPYTQKSMTIKIKDTNNKTIATLTTSQSDGTYNSLAILPAGTYTVQLTSSIPSGYYMTEPVNGSPPQFIVSVGKPCSSGSSLNAYCKNYNVKELDFGFTNYQPRYQSVCGDIRQDSGISDAIPYNATCGSSPAAPFASTTNNTCTNSPGIPFSGNTDPQFGQGSANSQGWLAGTANYNESFTPDTSKLIRTSFTYMKTTANESGLTPINIISYCGGSNPSLSNCTLTNIPHGLYIANNDLYLNNYTEPAGQNIVILVDGNLYIQGNIIVPTTSTLTVSAHKNIYVASSVGNADQTSTTGNVEGFFSADKSFIVNTSGTCPDLRLNIEGSIVTNAGLGGGTLQNNRDLCSGDAFCPPLSITQRPDFLLNAPGFIKHASSLYQEIIP